MTKLDDCQTYRHHQTCGRHTIKVLNASTDEYANVPMLAIIRYFQRIVNELAPRRTFLSGESTIACTGEGMIFPVAAPSTMDLVTPYTLTIVSVLKAASTTKDAQGFSVKVTPVVDRYERIFGTATTMDDIKRGLDELEKAFAELE